MLKPLKQLLSFILLFAVSLDTLAGVFWMAGDVYRCQASAENKSVILSSDFNEQSLEPLINAGQCELQSLYSIDPQNSHHLIIIPFTNDAKLQAIEPPLGIYTFAKASSHIYLNNQLIGKNGTPARDAENEKAGVMDIVYYVPSNLLQEETNYLVYEMSSHLGYLELRSPVHLIGFASYQPAQNYVQQLTPLGLVLSGIFSLGCIYFAALMFNPRGRKNVIYFLSMSITVTAQLWLEISRVIFPYEYPFHDIRLILISTCSFIFGILLLMFISSSYNDKYRIHWIYLAAVTTLLLIILTPSYDIKTALGILIPSTFATLQIAIHTFKKPDRSNISYLIAFVGFLILIINSNHFFHEIIFYIVIAIMLCYLFIQQAIAFGKEQQARHDDEKKLSQLAYRLDQAKQQIKPATINIPSAGEITKIATSEITFCKAAGDYVEIYLKEAQRQLFNGSLKGLLEQLPANFLRVHRSYAVNMEYVSNIQSSQTAGIITLNNLEEIPVSRRLLPSVRKVFANN